MGVKLNINNKNIFSIKHRRWTAEALRISHHPRRWIVSFGYIFFSKLLVSISYMGDIFGYIWGEYACVRLIYLNIFDVNTLVSAGYICGQMLTGNRWINMAGDRYMQTDLYTNVMQGWIILVLSFGFKWFANVTKNHSRYVFFWGVSSKDTCYSESGASGELHRD